MNTECIECCNFVECEISGLTTYSQLPQQLLLTDIPYVCAIEMYTSFFLQAYGSKRNASAEDPWSKHLVV